MFDRVKSMRVLIADRSRCFGFVTFQDPSVADQVTCINHFLHGRAIDVKKAVPKSESYSDVVNFDQNFVTNKIFVGGLPMTADERELQRIFSRYGAIMDAVIIQDKTTSKPRGFGFVEFTDTRAVDRVMSEYYSINIHGKWVECKKALPKLSYPDCMKGARPVRMIFKNDEDDILEDGVEDNVLMARSGNQIQEAPLMTRQVLGEFKANSKPTDVGDKIAQAFRFVSCQEDKENFRTTDNVISLEADNYYGDENCPFRGLKPQSKDPRKGKLLELKNKSRKLNLTLGMNLQSERDQRTFDVC